MDWGDNESESDVEEIVEQPNTGDSDSGEDGPREVVEVATSPAASAWFLGEAGPTRVDGGFRMHNFLFQEHQFDPGLGFDMLAFNVLFYYRAVKWLEVASPF